MRVTFPVIGPREVAPSAVPGHFLWLGLDGWHDCYPCEDAIVCASI